MNGSTPARPSLAATPLAAVGALVGLNAIGVLGTDLERPALLWIHAGAMILGLILAWLFRPRRAARIAAVPAPTVLTAERVLAGVSALVVLFLLARAGADPLTYILNLNHYRLSVNRDVGYAKFVLNLWAVVGVVAFLRQGKGFGRFILLPGLVNVFWGYRFCFAFAMFSALFAALVRGPLKMRYIAVSVLAFVLFSGFAIWRDLTYRQIDVADAAAFIFDLSDAGLATALLVHGFAEHFVTLRNLSDAVAFSESGLSAPHYGVEYLSQIARMVRLGDVFGVGVSVDIQFNAFLRGLQPSDLDAFDAGGVVIGLPGSLMIAGGELALAVGSLAWAWLCAKVIRRIQLGGSQMHLAMLPYILVIYQSPETNIPRVAVILAAYHLVLMAATLRAVDRTSLRSTYTQDPTNGT